MRSFSSVEVNGEPIHDWDYLTVYNYAGGKPSLDDVRLYYSPNEGDEEAPQLDNPGFAFCAVRVDREPHGDHAFEDIGETMVTVLVDGWAAHDGIRRTNFRGDDQLDGYFDQLSPRVFQALFEALQDLQTEHCGETMPLWQNGELYPDTRGDNQ